MIFGSASFRSSSLLLFSVSTAVKPVVPRQAKIGQHRYHGRVLRWFDLRHRGSQSFSHENLLYHSWPLYGDTVLFDCAKAEDRANQMYPGKNDKSYQLGGEIIYHDGRHRYVVFHATKDSHGICYHRGFVEKEREHFLQEYMMRGYWDVNFPPLGQEPEEEAVDNPISLVKAYDTGKVVKDNSVFTEIKDTLNNVRIIIYKGSSK